MAGRKLVHATTPVSNICPSGCLPQLRSFHATVEVAPATAKMRLVENSIYYKRSDGLAIEPVRDAKTRDVVCRAFANAYIAEGAKLPAETQESRYYDRLIQAYPIHPEVFDRHGCPEDSPARYGLPIKTKAPLVMKNDN